MRSLAAVTIAGLVLGSAHTEAIAQSDEQSQVVVNPPPLLVKNEKGPKLPERVTFKTVAMVKCKRGNTKCEEFVANILARRATFDVEYGDREECASNNIRPKPWYRGHGPTPPQLYPHPLNPYGWLPRFRGEVEKEGGHTNPLTGSYKEGGWLYKGFIGSIVREYRTDVEPISGNDYTAVCINVSGRIDATKIGMHRKISHPHNDLEMAVQGTAQEILKDRAAWYFQSADAFKKCIKREYTSAHAQGDTTGRSEECEASIVNGHGWPYFHGHYSPKEQERMRKGEFMRKYYLGGDNDGITGIELTEFEVSVEKNK